jgi:hypothetical protein
MPGSIGVAFWIAHGAFWLLIVVAVVVEQRVRLAATFVASWLAGYLGSAWLPFASAWFLSYVAVLDIALVLLVFKGDVRVT